MCAKNFIQAIWLKIQNVSKHYRNRPHLEILYTGVSGLFDNGLEHFPCALMLMLVLKITMFKFAKKTIHDIDILKKM